MNGNDITSAISYLINIWGLTYKNAREVVNGVVRNGGELSAYNLVDMGKFLGLIK